MLKSLRKWIAGVSPTGPKGPSQGSACFLLRFHELPVGILKLAEGKWQFIYTDDFKRATTLRPLLEFPDVQKVYESHELWPFFFMRIPSLKQTSVEDIVKSEKIDAADEAQLLRRFGRRTVANPFELVVVDHPQSPLDQWRSGEVAARNQLLAATKECVAH